jgi:hypothetical protein
MWLRRKLCHRCSRFGFDAALQNGELVAERKVLDDQALAAAE